ncbi:LysR family transcriptional regulator [Pseudoalteromonas sp. MMG005]|uniref:LysR family transcriptional regulator n=1 Tax=Pseudoalteromonas sp. MMG005 TaxID=2822682 RepID=UPI001B3A5CA1|nr:LysR family transcriptional regulator [Pseudoalteromonas sp. MMG005]MBQ4846733.1 LysR family transcriptional regulator [Pseudoalteromonas sp. MMG005]
MTTQFSFSAIHTFTVVTQTLSFSRAAEILHITPSAISHQMKLLESQLGVSLFTRQSKGIMLTEAGKALMENANKGVSLIQEGVSKSISTTKLRTLHIAAIPSLAQNWLLPKLPDFYDLHPDISIVLHAQDQLVNFSTSHIDAHLHFGTGYTQNNHAQFLASEYVYPVCHPDLLTVGCDNHISRLVSQYPLLQYNAALEDGLSNLTWQHWLSKHHICVDTKMIHRHFSHVGLSLEAAKHKQGLALAWHHMVSDLIKWGMLVQCGNTVLKLDYNYYLVSPEKPQEASDLHQFTSWLKHKFIHASQPHNL